VHFLSHIRVAQTHETSLQNYSAMWGHEITNCLVLYTVYQNCIGRWASYLMMAYNLHFKVSMLSMKNLDAADINIYSTNSRLYMISMCGADAFANTFKMFPSYLPNLNLFIFQPKFVIEFRMKTIKRRIRGGGRRGGFGATYQNVWKLGFHHLHILTLNLHFYTGF
jgi:hypothetical protein